MVWREKDRWAVNADCTVGHDFQVLWHRLENLLVWVRKSCYHSNVYMGEIIYMRKLKKKTYRFIVISFSQLKSITLPFTDAG